MATKYVHNLKQKAPKQEVKQRSKKGKRFWLDPDAPNTILDIQSQQAEEKEAQESASSHTSSTAKGSAAQEGKRSKAKPGSVQAAVAEAVEDKCTVLDAGHMLGKGIKMNTTGDRTEVTRRLQEKIEEMRAKRNSKPVDRDARKEEREKKRKRQQEKRKAASLVKAPPAPFDPTDRRNLEKKDQPNASGEGAIVFSKFDFGEANNKKAKPRQTPQQLLKKVEAQKQKLKELAAVDKEKANKMVERDAWNKAFQRAEGTKIFDDPKLLKKKIKREERAKTKSTKAWKEREESVDKHLKQRQEKRNKNLQDRTKAKLDKRRAKAAKKRPGFVSGGVSK